MSTIAVLMIAYFGLDVLVTAAMVGKNIYVTPATVVVTIITHVLAVLAVLSLV